MGMVTKLMQLGVMALALGGVSVANAGVIYDTTGGAVAGADSLASAGPLLADLVFNPIADHLTSVTLQLERSGPATAAFGVIVASLTGTVSLVAVVPDAALSTSLQLLTFTPSTSIALNAASFYFVGIVDLGGSSADLGITVDPAVLARLPVIEGAFYFNNTGLQANAGGPYVMAVDATLPEPAGLAALLGGAVVLGLAVRKRATH